MEEVFENIKNRLLEKFDCEAIILFGSFARESQNAESDIDIAIKTESEISKKDIYYLKQELEDIAKRDIDLIDLNAIGDVFKYEILMTGKILYCKNEFDFEMYKLRVFREFFDLNEYRKPIIDRVKNGGTIYGK